MNKDQYIESLEKLTQQAKEITEQIKSLRNEYIETNKTLVFGDKVKITDRNGNERIAIVNGFKLDYHSNIEPILLKVKKDGNASMHKDYLFRSEKIELLINP